MSDDICNDQKIDLIETSFQHWLEVNRGTVPHLYINLFRGAHSAGWWDAYHSEPRYEKLQDELAAARHRVAELESDLTRYKNAVMNCEGGSLVGCSCNFGDASPFY